MTDINQILIVAAITVMTIILAIIGIQLIFMLREVRNLLKRTDAIMSKVESFGLNIEHSFGEITGFVTGIKKLLVVAEHLSERKRKKDGKK